MTRNKHIGVILYTNPDYYPVTAHAVELLSKEFDITLIGRNQEKSFWQYPSNVSVCRLGNYSSVRAREKFSSKKKLSEYYQFVKKSSHLLKNASLIYAYDSYAYVAAYLCCMLLRKPIPIVYQNHEISDKLPSLLSLSGWIDRLERLWINDAKMIILPDKDRAAYFKIANSLEQEPMIVPNFPPKNFIDAVDSWDELLEKRWKTLTLFYRGTISDVSAMEEIVAASATVDNALIRFVGFLNDSERKVLEQVVADSGVSERFKYLGKLPYQDLQAHTLNASVGFALYKGIDLNRTACVSACQKIYEYAACGLPVVVTDSPNYRSYLGEEPWVKFANPSDPESVALAINHILSDFDSYKKMCLSARQAFENRFNYESVFIPVISDLKDLMLA